MLRPSGHGSMASAMGTEPWKRWARHHEHSTMGTAPWTRHLEHGTWALRAQHHGNYGHSSLDTAPRAPWTQHLEHGTTGTEPWALQARHHGRYGHSTVAMAPQNQKTPLRSPNHQLISTMHTNPRHSAP